jgi:hypothetical protein
MQNIKHDRGGQVSMQNIKHGRGEVSMHTSTNSKRRLIVQQTRCHASARMMRLSFVFSAMCVSGGHGMVAASSSSYQLPLLASPH